MREAAGPAGPGRGDAGGPAEPGAASTAGRAPEGNSVQPKRKAREAGGATPAASPRPSGAKGGRKRSRKTLGPSPPPLLADEPNAGAQKPFRTEVMATDLSRLQMEISPAGGGAGGSQSSSRFSDRAGSPSPMSGSGLGSPRVYLRGKAKVPGKALRKLGVRETPISKLSFPGVPVSPSDPLPTSDLRRTALLRSIFKQDQEDAQRPSRTPRRRPVDSRVATRLSMGSPVSVEMSEAR